MHCLLAVDKGKLSERVLEIDITYERSVGHVCFCAKLSAQRILTHPQRNARRPQDENKHKQEGKDSKVTIA